MTEITAPTDDWRVGRRVVELGVIADHLQQCKHCGLPLSLHNTINIKTYGLGSDGNDNVTVSVDAAWQRRGNGRSYDSLTGHCSMIGSKTGKVINYKWRSKACRICQRAEISGNIPRVHKCNKNFTGSAKAMEPDMVVDMVKESRSKGANITAIIGDEDTTTIARLRAKVDPTIVKLSDSNHMKKPIRNRLYELKNKHSTLSPKVISYIMKCFNYLIAQGKGQPKKIEENLNALSKHPLEITVPVPQIGVDLLQIQASKKLANLGSTQSNESFNKSVAAKAPKNRFYGGSRSLAYRVAAAVAQKNTGHKYTVDVNVSSGLSPGLYTRKLATLRDIQARKRKAVAITTEAKLRRIALKASRKNTPPLVVQHGRTSHITQISARRGLETFSKYILPAREITPKAAEVTGLTFQNGSLYLLDKIVPAVGVKEGLTGFISFLEKSTNNVIFGHNIYNYDCPVLYNALDNCSLLDDFQSKIVGFVDTLKLFKLSFPNLGSYSQCKLCDTLINLSYDAHNAEDDVNALFRLVNEKIDNFTDVQKVFQSELSVFYNYVSLKQMNKNVPSLKQMLDDKVVTKRTANCIARSGLNLSHLRLAYSRNGRTGIKDIFSEPCGSKARVTKSAKIIDSVSDFLKEL
ncbi:unnamed protein product [Mytilus coruscus]|uniref:Exonuclease domain-containing protein n=1 Tax=Mytilus coruscus TaxID=42192 RepID=A0A6J8ACS0_MYTCO|nr:unnamed protein product [Mytilus coruscus]